MFDYILVIINLFLIQLAHNTLVTKALLSCFFILFLVYYFNKKTTKITIEDLSIKHGVDVVPFLLLFFVFYIFGLFYMRFYNLGKSLDLKDLCNKVMVFFMKQDFSYILITLLFYTLLLIIFLIIFYRVMKAIKLNLFKIHIYIKSFFSLGFFQSTPYNTFTTNYFLFYMKLSGIFTTVYRLILKYIYIYIYKQKYDYYKRDKVHLFLSKISDKNAFIFLIILIIYDIIFNNFVLTKMYYMIPIVFLYNLIILINNILSIFQPFDEGAIVSHLYFDVETIKHDTLEIQYTNKFTVTVHDLKKIENTLNEEFL